MTSLAVFFFQISIPLFLATVVTVYLRGATRRLLTDLCGTVDRAEFWIRITAVLTSAAPLSLVLIFAHTPPACTLTTGECLGEVVRQAVSLSLMGIIAAVAVLAQTIWKQIPGVTPAAHPGGSS